LWNIEISGGGRGQDLYVDKERTRETLCEVNDLISRNDNARDKKMETFLPRLKEMCDVDGYMERGNACLRSIRGNVCAI